MHTQSFVCQQRLAPAFAPVGAVSQQMAAAARPHCSKVRLPPDPEPTPTAAHAGPWLSHHHDMEPRCRWQGLCWGGSMRPLRGSSLGSARAVLNHQIPQQNMAGHSGMVLVTGRLLSWGCPDGQQTVCTGRGKGVLSRGATSLAGGELNAQSHTFS